ncbi:hypothetical protein QN391_21360 [Pseudomonas sp. CCI1.2]|uniref:hypothetical protein n=1 Tax=Pseudomonas sp. CCI1.2 TaxID=3048614 RepID=UPI002B23DEAA|nr:hypothetical protein [Pseudomonas sp. CCI1.2]MEB0123208.1 hypothetical protein [Pseudomonas sp. CCI1.2]
MPWAVESIEEGFFRQNDLLAWKATGGLSLRSQNWFRHLLLVRFTAIKRVAYGGLIRFGIVTACWLHEILA